MTKEQALAALASMDDETRELLKKIVYSDSPTKVREAYVLLSTFHHFRMET